MQIKKSTILTGHNASIFALANYQNDRYFLSGGGEGWIVRWDLEDPEMGKLLAKVETQVFSLCYLPDYDQIVAGNMNGGVHWINLDNPDATKNVQHHRKGVFAIQQIGEFVFTAGGAGMLTRWSIEEQRTVESYHLSNQSLRSVDFSKDRNEIAVGASDNHIYLLDASSLELKKVINNAHDNSVFVVRYAPNGRHLVSGGRDAHLRVWDIANDFAALHAMPAHWYTINAIAFHPVEPVLATGSRDKTIKLWDTDNYQLLKVIETVRDQGHLNSVNRLLWSSYQNQLISGSDDRSIRLWELEK